MRKLGTLLVAGAFGMIGALALVAPASATEPDCKTFTTQLTARPDSGTNGTWAIDTITRTTKICVVPEEVEATPAAKVMVPVEGWKYQVTVSDKGTFKTLGGVNLSPGNNHELKANVEGTIEGSFKQVVTAPSEWMYFTPAKFDGKTMNGNPETSGSDDVFTSSEWASKFWSQGYESKGMYAWKWKYKTCNESWLNAESGNHGDITGLSTKSFGIYSNCGEVVFKDTCDGVTITLKNNAPSDKAVAKFKVEDKWYEVKGGASTEVKVVAPTSDVKVYQKYVKKPFTHKWVKPNCEVTPTVPPTIPPTTPAAVPGAGGGLPKTGPNGILLGGIGTAVLIIGGAAYFLARTRRRDEIVTVLPE